MEIPLSKELSSQSISISQSEQLDSLSKKRKVIFIFLHFFMKYFYFFNNHLKKFIVF